MTSIAQCIKQNMPDSRINQLVLYTISQSDPVYAIALQTFVEENPEFYSYMKYAPKELKPQVPPQVQTLKQGIIYYICCTGVRYAFALQLFAKVYNSHYLLQEPITSTLALVTQGKKNAIEKALNLPNDYTMEAFKNSKLTGIGVSGKSFLIARFDPSGPNYESTEYTDSSVQKGLQIIYNMSKRPSASESKKIVDSWKTEYKYIGSTLCSQTYNFMPKY